MSKLLTSAKKQSTISDRLTFVDREDDKLIHHMFDHQLESWNTFANEGLKDLFQSFNPIEIEIKKNDQNYRLILNFKNHKFEKPKMTDQEALDNNLTYEATLKVDVELINETTGVKKVQEVYLGEYPWMTESGNFIINGKKRIVITQIIRSVGVFFEEVEINANQKLKFDTDQQVFSAKIIPDRGAWLKIETSPRDGALFIVIGNKYRLPVTNFLQAIGMTIDEIYKAFANVDTGKIKHIEETFKHKNSVHNYQSALIEVYKSIKPGDLASLENAKEALDSKFFNYKHYDLSPVGRYKINKRLNLKTGTDLEHRVLQKEDFIAIISEVIRLNNTPAAPSDDIDDLSNRRLKTVGELILRYFRLGLLRMEKNIRERMLRLDIDDIMPQRLINSRPIVAVVKTFFATSQLSQYMSQENPAAELGHKRRMSAMGPGGLKREYAKYTPRDAHLTHYGRICPVETSEGANIGLLLNMSIYSRINKYGFLETPYYKVLSKAIAKEAVGHLAGADLIDREGQIIVAKGQAISQPAADRLASIDSVKKWPLKPKLLKDQIVYLDAEEEKQYVILTFSTNVDEKGYFLDEFTKGRWGSFAGQYEVQTGDYMDVAANQIIGSSAGLIPFIEKDNVVRSLTGANQTRQAVPLLNPKSPIVGTGLEETIAKYSNQVVYAEAAGVVNQATADQVIVTYDNKHKKTYPLTHYQRSNQDTAIDQRVVVNKGDKIIKGQPLIEGMSIDGGELALGRDLLVAVMSWDGDNFEDAIVVSQRLIKDDELTNVLITEYTTEVRETKLGPEITTLDIPNVSEEALSHLDEMGIIRIGARVKTGDILVGKITPKGEQELSNEERLLRAIFGEKAKDVRDTSLRLPNGQSGKVVGVNIFSKDRGHNLKAGVIMQIQVFVAQSYKVQVGDKLAGRHGNKGVIARVVSEEDMPFTEDGQSVDILLNPLGIIARRNLGQIFEAHLGIAANKLGIKIATPPFNGVSKEQIQALLQDAGLPPDGKQQLYDGRTGEPFKERTMIGYMYMYKLTHMAFNKMHVRSTGPYTMITQQPLGGKSKNGGQRFGEMEVWALESYGAAYSLQEMLTLKSDDMYGRFKAYESIVKQSDISSPRIPESFNVLVKELQGLGLKMDLINTDNQLVNAEEIIESNSSESNTQLSGGKIAPIDKFINEEITPVLDEEEIDEFFEDVEVEAELPSDADIAQEIEDKEVETT